MDNFNFTLAIQGSLPPACALLAHACDKREWCVRRLLQGGTLYDTLMGLSGVDSPAALVRNIRKDPRIKAAGVVVKSTYSDFDAGGVEHAGVRWELVPHDS
jgi:hypothetical protein